MWRNCTGSHLHCNCVLIKYGNLWLLKGIDYGKFRWSESLHDNHCSGVTQPSNVFMVHPLFFVQDMQCCGKQLQLMSVAVKPRFNCFFFRVQSAGTQCLQLYGVIPSFFKTGRHSYWWLSTLSLMHLWAQLHRQSLFGTCASKSESCWMNLSSCWPRTTVWLQLLLCPYQLIVDCCNLFSCSGTVVLHAHWCITIIVAITVIGIVKVALAFRCIQLHNNIDPCIGGHIGHLLLCDTGDANQR